MKIMTFNIQHCRDYINRNIDIDLFVEAIKKFNPDIVGLNEVYGEYDNNRSQAQEIASKLGLNYYFGKALDYHGIPYGNAILSRFNFQNVETIKIPNPIQTTEGPYESRCIIKASFVNLTVLVSHFGLMPSEQENAVASASKIIKESKTPIILMGDFNMENNNPILNPINDLLINTLPNGDFTYPSIDPVKKIDYIFVSKNIKIVEAMIPNLVASDHLPHIAKIKLN